MRLLMAYGCYYGAALLSGVTHLGQLAVQDELLAELTVQLALLALWE